MPSYTVVERDSKNRHPFNGVSAGIARIACRLSKMDLTNYRLDIGKLDMVWLG
jgi:hypothetical protein